MNQIVTCTVSGVNKWWLLAATIGCEVVATLSLKAALNAPWLYVVVVSGYVTSYWLLSVLLRRGMPLGITYGLWGACGVALTAIFGAILYDEALSFLSSFGISLIIVGIVLVECGSPTHAEGLTNS